MSLIEKSRWQGAARYLWWGAAGLVLLGVLVWLGWGRLDLDDPWIKFKTPVEVVGVKTALTVEAGDQTSGLRAVKITLSQGDQHKELLAKSFPPGGAAGESVELAVTVEPKALGFKEGKATLTLQAWDRSWWDLFRGRTTILTRDVTIDLVPLSLSFQAVSHLLHAGGTGLICYRLNKPAKESGVVVGGRLYQGYHNPKGGEGDYVAFFPVPQEGPGLIQVELVARPGLGDDVKQTLSLRVKPRKWRHDKLALTDGFLRKVATTLAVSNPNDLLGSYLEVNREMRRQNHERVRQVCSQSNPQPLWSGAFQRFLGKAMARFGDRRTYMYQNKAVDEQIHLGEDLASLVNSPVPAANNGVVVLAEPLGIYGQTIMIDHGLGVFSGYSHLSQMDVKVGDRVEKGAILGKTGTTGLAGGDHLHFDIAIQGEFVDPLEWWDAHWLKDQVEKVWAAAGTPAGEGAQAAPAASKEAQGKQKPGKAKKAKAKKKS